jgi:type IV secretion system protein VirB1
VLPGMELLGCADLAVPTQVMHHVVRVESSFNPYAIGVVGGRLVRQPRNLPEALATVRMLERKGYNFSLGLAQVNRHNLLKYGLASYEQAFGTCANLQAGSRILAECHRRSGGDWGKAFSCYYSGDFVTGYRHGYVKKVLTSLWGDAAGVPAAQALPLAPARARHAAPARRAQAVQAPLLARRMQDGPRPGPDTTAAPTMATQTYAASAPGPAPVAAPQTAWSPFGPREPPVTVSLTGAAPSAGTRGGIARTTGGAPQPAAEGRDDAFVF